MTQPTDIQLPYFSDVLSDIADFFGGDLDQANCLRPEGIPLFQNWRDVFFSIGAASHDSTWSKLDELVPPYFWAS